MSSAPVPRDKLRSVIHARALPDVAARVVELVRTNVGDRRLNIELVDIANTFSPHEMVQIYRMIVETTDETGRQRIAQHAQLWNQFLTRGGAEYAREELFEGVALYRSAVQAEDRASLICFTGFLGTMFMSNCRFLELLGKFPIDIVLLSTENGTFGRWGLEGTNSFYTSLVFLKAALAERGIVPKCYVGASAGGASAAMAATLDGKAAGIMLSGRFYGPGRRIPIGDAGIAFDPFCPCWHGPRPDLYSIFGADEPTDAFYDRHLRTLMPQTKSYPIPKDGKHNPLATLRARQKLRDVMDLIAGVASGRSVSFDLVQSL